MATEIELLRRFADVCGVTGTVPRQGDDGRAWSAERLLRAYLAGVGTDLDELPPEFSDALRRCLARFHPAGVDVAGEERTEVLFRLWNARCALPEVAPVVEDVLRRWLAAAGDVVPDLGPDELDLLHRLTVSARDRFPRLTELCLSASDVLFASREPAPVPQGIDGDLDERLELWRFREFDWTRVSSVDDLHLFDLRARQRASDVRLVVVGRVEAPDVVRDQAGTIVGAPALEHALVQAVGAIRHERNTQPSELRSEFNRIVLYVDGRWVVPDEVLRDLAHRMAPLVRGLGLQKILLRVEGPGPDGSGAPSLIHIREPAEFGMTIVHTPPSSAPLRLVDPHRERSRRVRRRGLLPPEDIISLLTPQEGWESEFPPGRFEELDLDQDGRMVARGDRDRSEAGVVVGIVTSSTARYPEGMRRVAIVSDPGARMGALAEPECRRIIGAIDVAEEMGVPVEWFALSAGALIAMDSGTENLDWTGAVMRRIIRFCQGGGEINVVTTGVNVGAQSYFNAEATMLMHCRGILVMVAGSSMILTGKEAMDFSGGVSVEGNEAMGGYDDVMGPNGQAQFFARTVPEACAILYRYYDLTYVAPGERAPRPAPSADPRDRDVIEDPGLAEVLLPERNPERKRPFAIRDVMASVVDRDGPRLERWSAMAGAEGVVVWEARLGGGAVCLVGVESQALPRRGPAPPDGPAQWTAATLFPHGAKKLARALNAASGRRPAVILANLVGFDGSPESLRAGQLEFGAEIARSVVNFSGPLVLGVVSRYHGGAFVVFSKALNPGLQVLAVEGSYASVIGGNAAAAVVFQREVAALVDADPRVRQRIGELGDAGEIGADPSLQALLDEVRAEKAMVLARTFDATHSVARAREVGSIDRVFNPRSLRPELIGAVEKLTLVQ